MLKNLRVVSSAPRILYYDTEWGKAEFRFFTYDRKLYSSYLPSSAIHREKWMVCAAWRWLHENHTNCVSVLNDPERFKADYKDDYYVVKSLHEVMEQADIIVGHNSDRFDWKQFMARVIKYKLPPLKKPIMIDTLKAARKEAAFLANDLRYLCEHLEVDEKGRAANRDLIEQGDPEAIKEESRYCMQDVRSGIALYKRLMPYMSNHPNLNAMQDGVHHDTCPKCGHWDLEKRGFRYTNAGKYQAYRCKQETGGCGGSCQSKKNLKKVDIR